MSRLRELAEQAAANAEFYTPSGVLAEQSLRTLAPDLAVLLADAKDALASMVVEIPDVRERNATQFAGLNTYLSEEEHAAITALLARIEELEGRA